MQELESAEEHEKQSQGRHIATLQQQLAALQQQVCLAEGAFGRGEPSNGLGYGWDR